MSKGTPMRYVRVDNETWHQFQAATHAAGTNPSETVRQLIRDWLKKRKANDD